jgi:hypothetical protein
MRARLHRGLWQAGGLILLIALAACATKRGEPAEYVEPPKDSSAAYLEAIAPAWLAGVDGKKVSRMNFSGTTRFRISAGPHAVLVRLRGHEWGDTLKFRPPPYEGWHGGAFTGEIRIYSTNDAPVRFTAEAGRTYYVHDGRQGSTLWSPFINESRDPVYIDLKQP